MDNFKFLAGLGCRVTRLGQKIVIPIVLSTEFNIRLAFWGAVVPASVAVIADHFVLKPRRKKRLSEYVPFYYLVNLPGTAQVNNNTRYDQ
jgi:hypothetical protein